jgi:uncharacterized membrane protein YphA (DoxX/SURF4 family)
MRQTLLEAHVPFPKFNALFVSIVEFVFGAFSSTWLCDGTRLRDARGHFNYRDQKYQGKAATRLAIGVFVPSRGPLSVILFWLFLSGAGWFSVDHLLVSDARL